MPVAGPPGDVERIAALIEAWAERELGSHPVVASVDRDPEARRWYVRLRGEEKTVTTIWLTVRERTLHYETYFMPAPEENHRELWEFLLRVNARLFGMRFAIADEDAVYLVGQMPVGAVDGDELDRVIGATYAYAEQYFPAAMGIGYASKYRRHPG